MAMEVTRPNELLEVPKNSNSFTHTDNTQHPAPTHQLPRSQEVVDNSTFRRYCHIMNRPTLLYQPDRHTTVPNVSTSIGVSPFSNLNQSSDATMTIHTNMDESADTNTDVDSIRVRTKKRRSISRVHPPTNSHMANRDSSHSSTQSSEYESPEIDDVQPKKRSKKHQQPLDQLSRTNHVEMTTNELDVVALYYHNCLNFKS